MEDLDLFSAIEQNNNDDRKILDNDYRPLAEKLRGRIFSANGR